MVEAKFGLPQIAVRQLEIYTTAGQQGKCKNVG
jgi:phosphoenolpyruvate carboxylase